MKVFATFVALLGACALASGNTVPALVWGNFDHTPVNAIRQYTQADFIEILKTHRTDETTTIVFTEDILSTDDLSKYRASFSGLQRIDSKLYLSSVDAPLAAVEQLTDGSADVHRITAEQAINGPLPAGRFVFVDLTAAVAGEETRAEELARHDVEIAAISAKLASRADTLFVYTARQSAPVAVRSRQIRQATAAPAGTAVHFNSEHLMVYFTNLTFNDQTVPIASLSATLANHTVSVRLHGATVADDLTFDVVTDGRNWWSVQNVVFRTEALLVRDQEIGALPEFSYHCGPALEFTTLKGVRSPLLWSGLQIEANFEPNAEKRAEFSEPWDCVGFVSPGMLGGFFVVLLMLAIVTIGLTWIMDIRTMDRFDDPKGKAIVMAATE